MELTLTALGPGLYFLGGFLYGVGLVALLWKIGANPK